MSIYWLMCSVVMCFFVVYGIDFIVKLKIFLFILCICTYVCCMHVNTYRIAGNFRGMYISWSSHKTGILQIKFCGWPKMKLIFN